MTAEEKKINYNMRCIETSLQSIIYSVSVVINYNMRCIETTFSETTSILYPINYNMRCIETRIGTQPCAVLPDKLQHEMY